MRKQRIEITVTKEFGKEIKKMAGPFPVATYIKGLIVDDMCGKEHDRVLQEYNDELKEKIKALEAKLIEKDEHINQLQEDLSAVTHDY